MKKRNGLILIGSLTLFTLISCKANVDTNVYVKTNADFTSLVKEVEWDIGTVPEGKASFDTKSNILTITSSSTKVVDTFSYLFRNGKLTLRDIKADGAYKALNNASTRVTLLNCSHDIKGSLKSYDLGLHDLGITLSQTCSEAELLFEANFREGWNAVVESTQKTASVSINPKANEIVFTVEGGTNPTIANYKIKEMQGNEITIVLSNIDYTSDFYFEPGEITFNNSLPNKEIELSTLPKVLLKKVVTSGL